MGITAKKMQSINKSNTSFVKTWSPMEFWKSEFWVGYVYAFFAWVASFLTPLAPFLILVICLVFADLYTGLKAARFRKESISSRGLGRTVEKFTLYFIAILASEGLTVVLLPNVQFAYIAAFTISITEFKSIIENVEEVTGVKIWTIIKQNFSGKFPGKK
jgi:phage-related holin